MPNRIPRLSVAFVSAGVWSASGEIDAGTAGMVVESVLPTEEAMVTIDMASVTFVDSSGLRMLIELQRQLGDAGQRLMLRTPQPSFVRLLEIAGLQDHLSITP